MIAVFLRNEGLREGLWPERFLASPCVVKMNSTSRMIEKVFKLMYFVLYDEAVAANERIGGT